MANYERYTPEFQASDGRIYGVKDKDAREEIANLNSAINTLGDEIVETKTVELLQAKILSYESYFDGSVVNNGDGSYTIGTTSYGSVEFGNQYLPAGKYRLFGSAVGFSYITIGSNNWQNPVASNDTNDYKEIELTEGGDYYIGHRTRSNPTESFTIIPSLIYEYSVDKIDEGFNEKANLIGNTPVSGTTIGLSALTINDDGTITHGTTDYGTIMLANQLVLQPGTYYLFGIDNFNGFGFVSEQETVREVQDALVYNKSVIPKEFQIETEKTVYVGYRSRNYPSKPFTFKPELLIERSKYVEQSALDDVNAKADTGIEIGTTLSARFNVSLTEVHGRNMYPDGNGDLIENGNGNRGYTQIETIPAKTIRVSQNENMDSVRVIVYERNTETRKWSSLEDAWHRGTYEYTFSDNSDLFFVELDISGVTIPEGVNCINVICLTVQNRLAVRNYKSYMYEIYKDQATAFRRQKTSSEGSDIVAFKAMLVSDVHMQEQRMQNIVDLVNKWGTDYFDALINCGDTMNGGTDDPSWYYQMTDGLVVPSLNTVGNHDVYNGLTQNQTYDKIIAPLTSQSGIVQPENASTLGLCYYYHDFTKVRVIVVDCMHWDTAQATWFETVLTDAQTNNLYVIACSHYGFDRSISTHIPSVWGVQDEATNSINSQAAEKVSAFITSGGTFICWLAGHEHGDNIHVLQNHGNQIVVSLPTLTQRALTLWPNSDANAYNYDVMTYFAVDDYKKLIKFMRFGADIDMYGVKKSGVVLNYETGELVAAY